MPHDHHHHLAGASHSEAHDERYYAIRKVTLIGSVVDLLLGVIKIVVGYVGSSQALIADGIHSLSDLLTDFMVLFAAKHAARGADEEHPYGHARIETLMTVVLGVTLILVAMGIGYDALLRMFDPASLLHPGLLALSVAAISIVSKEAIYQYTLRAANRLRSALLRANAWHSRSDALSSVIVFIGVLGSMAGLDYLDAIAAIGVAMMISKIGWDLSWQSIRELIDTGLETEQVEKIRQRIGEVPGVEALHMLRTRRMGEDALVDVHIQVAPRVSVSEGHQISETVRQCLIDELDEVMDVMVHIDPEDDEIIQNASNDLPDRSELETWLQENWKGIPEASKIKNLAIHYLKGKLYIECQLPLEAMAGADEARVIAEKLKEAALKHPSIARVRISYFID